MVNQDNIQQIGRLSPASFQIQKDMSIGEASKFLGVNVSTLRYWEKEFSQFLKTKRTEGKQRRYTDQNIKVLQEIKYLIDIEKYTIDGAKRRMAINRQQKSSFQEIITNALEKIEQGAPKQEVIENIVQREHLGL